MDRLTHERLNGIRNGYWSPNKKQELVDRLAAYEKTNLDPEQVEHVKEAAKKYLLEKAQRKVDGWIPMGERLPEVDVVIEKTIEDAEKYIAEKYGIRGDVDGQESDLRVRGCESAGEGDGG